MASQDPYNLVKQELQETVNEVQEKFVRWGEYRPTNPLRNKTGEDLERGCGSILWQLDELQQAIDIASQDPVKFNLTELELNNRQSWVRNTRRQINTIQESVKAASSKNERGYGKSGISRAERENEEFLSNQKMEQEMVIRRQDEELEHMEKAVSRIGNVGLTIHGELRSQEDLLKTLDEDVDITGSRLKAAQLKIQEVMKRSGGNCQVCVIVGLSVVLLVLIVVAVAT